MKKFFAHFIAVACVFIQQTPAQARGGISSNGGDGVVSEVFDIARSIHRMLVQQKHKSVNVDLFATTIENAEIFSQEKVYLGKDEVSAINTPSLQEIRVSQTRWKDLLETPKLKYVLVLHEFLGLMGYDDRTFSISNKILNGPGIEINRVSCPFLTGSSISNASHYTLELLEYRVENHNEFRAVVYLNGLPDGNSETLSADRMKVTYSEGQIKSMIGTTGSSLIMKNNPLSGGIMVHFDVWPGTPFTGTVAIQQEHPAETVRFSCRGHFH
ncbi:MAG: hypothetical protein IPJ84_05220 [Bdellovibrionales bacterium]|nr:hypothetical protein [Bdellovibrionales bacterium]